VVGPRATHGVILDFVNKLRKDNIKLVVLGDGKQRKGYIYVKDCVSAMMFIVKNASAKLNIYNIASSGAVRVDQIAMSAIDKMGLKKVKIVHTGGRQGWRGDVPVSYLSSKKLNRLGFIPTHNSKHAIDQAICDIIKETG
jgi:UDP-glucose 4-epimerase